MNASLKNIFVPGSISPEKIAQSIAHHANKTSIGGHDIFLGQVRADHINGNIVQAIEFTANESLALTIAHDLRETAFQKFDITCLHIYHSIGLVPTGSICFFVFVSAPHRKAAFDACRWLVDALKEQLPVWGKEITDLGFTWKENHG